MGRGQGTVVDRLCWNDWCIGCNWWKWCDIGHGYFKINQIIIKSFYLCYFNIFRGSNIMDYAIHCRWISTYRSGHCIAGFADRNWPQRVHKTVCSTVGRHRSYGNYDSFVRVINAFVVFLFKQKKKQQKTPTKWSIRNTYRIQSERQFVVCSQNNQVDIAVSEQRNHGLQTKNPVAIRRQFTVAQFSSSCDRKMRASVMLGVT